MVSDQAYDGDPRTIKVQSIGTDEADSRLVAMDMTVTKDREVLTYAVAGRGPCGSPERHHSRQHLQYLESRGDLAIQRHKRLHVHGTINTVRARPERHVPAATLNGDDQPIDINGDPLTDDYAQRYCLILTRFRAIHEGINYGQPYNDMPRTSTTTTRTPLQDQSDLDRGERDQGHRVLSPCHRQLRPPQGQLQPQPVREPDALERAPGDQDALVREELPRSRTCSASTLSDRAVPVITTTTSQVELHVQRRHHLEYPRVPTGSIIACISRGEATFDDQKPSSPFRT